MATPDVSPIPTVGYTILPANNWLFQVANACLLVRLRFHFSILAQSYSCHHL